MGFWSWMLFKNEQEVKSEVIDRDVFIEDARYIVRSYFDSNSSALFYAKLCGYEYDVSGKDGYIECALSSSEAISQEGIACTMDWLQKDFEYMYFDHWENTFKDYHSGMLSADTIADLEAIFNKYSKSAFSKAFEECHSEIASFAVNLVISRRDIDIGNLKYRLEDKWSYLKSILRNALLADVDKYGEQDYDIFHSECKAFTNKFMPVESLKFYDAVLIWVKMSSIAILKLEEEPAGTSRDIPVDGIEFEVWCAERFIELGWDVQLTTKTGDQGVDLVVRKDNLTVAVQCKRYSQPVGNKAVQEAYSGKQHIGADYACVIATAGFTKSAEELARTTLVYLVEAGDIDIFAEFVSREIEV